MSEIRKPTVSFTVRFADKSGTKLTKIDIFPAYLYADKWNPLTDKFYPKLPLHSQRRKEYWENMFRVSVNGFIVETKAKYTLFTREQIYQKWLNF